MSEVVSELRKCNELQHGYQLNSLKQILELVGIDSNKVEQVLQQFTGINPFLDIHDDCGPLRSSYARDKFFAENRN